MMAVLTSHDKVAEMEFLLEQLPAERPYWVCLSIPLPNIDLLGWLRQQPHEQKLFWSGREDGIAVAGVGSAETLTRAVPTEDCIVALFKQLSHRLESAPASFRYFGGMRFDPQRGADADWERYGVYHFHVPQFMLKQSAHATQLICNVRFDQSPESLLEQLAELRFDLFPLEQGIPHPITRYDQPTREEWAEKIEMLLHLFASGRAKKVVLARKVTVPADGPLDPILTLEKLRAVTPHSFHFCFQLDDAHAFIGASPERLYRREGRMIISEAVAGTRKRGESDEEDERLADELLSSEKDRHEQRLVAESIRAVFERLCDEVDQDDPEPCLLRLSQLQHLYNQIIGRLGPRVTDGEIVQGLHPTPAVGGFPQPIAQATIAALEPFDRGWYAGLVGWVGREGAEFAVAIRSALIKGDALAAFSGAGIVPDSTAESEWQEIENKLLNFRRALL